MRLFSSILGALALCATLSGAYAAPSLLQQFPVKAAPAKKGGAAQSQVALKTPFPSVAAGALKGALDAKNLAVAKRSVGKVALFSGVVASVYAPKHGKFVLLNFAKDYKTALVGSVKAKDFRGFPDLKTLQGKRVAVRGPVMLFKGAPEIELTGPGAIRLVK